MFFNQFPPEKKFEDYIESLIYYKGYTPEHSIEKVIPDGTINLVFELDGFTRNVFDNETLEPKQEFTKVWLSGVQKQYISISAHKDSEMYVIRFKPGGAYPFIKQTIRDFTDKVQPAENVFGEEIFEFREALLKAEDINQKRDIGFEWLNQKFDGNRISRKRVFESIKKIIEDPQFQEYNLKDLIAETGYSKKQFIKIFKKYVGITPKYFQRIVRFNEILQKIQNSEKLSWTRISQDCGFYDQAHFIREFQHFCGYNPQAHLDTPLINERVNFFPVD